MFTHPAATSTLNTAPNIPAPRGTHDARLNRWANRLTKVAATVGVIAAALACKQAITGAEDFSLAEPHEAFNHLSNAAYYGMYAVGAFLTSSIVSHQFHRAPETEVHDPRDLIAAHHRSDARPLLDSSTAIRYA